MNTDDIKILNNLNSAALNKPLEPFNIRDRVWSRINSETNIIEVDSFRYIAAICATAAIIALFFSADIISNIQNSVAWEIADQVITTY